MRRRRLFIGVGLVLGALLLAFLVLCMEAHKPQLLDASLLRGSGEALLKELGPPSHQSMIEGTSLVREEPCGLKLELAGHPALQRRRVTVSVWERSNALCCTRGCAFLVTDSESGAVLLFDSVSEGRPAFVLLGEAPKGVLP